MKEEKGFVVWLTGLPSSGKTTIAKLLEQRIRDLGLKVERLDGDTIREDFSKGVGFTREERTLHLRRVGFLCKLLARNGVCVVGAFVSPYKEIRRYLRDEIPNFIEVYVKCPIEVCIERDKEGLYKMAIEGKIENFTGISDPYEPPDEAEVVVRTEKNSPKECASRIMEFLEERGYIPKKETYTKEEEERIRERLKSLGYL